jgi:uncharacterized lipoprotein YddW (UPF0748 family)
MKRWLSVVCLLAILLSTSIFQLAHAEMNFSGKRAILDEDNGWASREGANRILRRIQEAGFNVYVPCVWHGRGVKWPSRLSPRDSDFDRLKDGYDPLRYLVGKAHEMGIEVHPWFNIVLRQAPIFPEYALPGSSPAGEAFDVHNEQFRQRMADVVGEVAQKYDVDGINLDYVRAVMLCTTASCKEEYHQKYGRDLATDALILNVSPKLVPTLVEYQESAVTELVNGISESVRREKPRILISVDAIPGFAGADQGQNSVDWVNKGMVDVLFRMDYYRSINSTLTETIRSQLKNPDTLSLLISNISHGENAPGQPHFARDGKWLAETVSMIQDRWPQTGVAVYFYKSLTDEQIAALKNGPFAMGGKSPNRPAQPLSRAERGP